MSRVAGHNGKGGWYSGVSAERVLSARPKLEGRGHRRELTAVKEAEQFIFRGSWAKRSVGMKGMRRSR